MQAIIEISRYLGSKYRWSFGKRGKIRRKIRDYLFSELGTDDNFGSDSAYAVVKNLDRKFLQDTDLGAGLVVCLAHVGGAVDALEMTGGMGRINVDEYIKRNEQEGIEKAVQFFGKGIKNYKTELENILKECYKSNTNITN